LRLSKNIGNFDIHIRINAPLNLIFFWMIYTRTINKKVFFILFLTCIEFSLFCQMEYPGEILGPMLNKGIGIPYISLENADKLLEQKIEKGIDEPYFFKIDEFAFVFQCDYSPENIGKWESNFNNKSIWRLGFTSANASSLSITFGNYSPNIGSRVFVYSPDGKTIEGAYTYRNANKTGVLAVSSIPGDSLVIELQQLDDNGFGRISITSVSIGYPLENSPKEAMDQYFDRSADCHVDINCINTPDVQLQKHSVCRLVIERPSGKLRCTGTLINNINGNGIPYVLTAGHCISDEYSANRTIFYFDYESPYCDGPDGELKSVSGSFLRSRADNLDFALLEMMERPPVDFYPLYAGWDATGDELDTSYIIHHPEGDVKKYSQNIEPVQTGTFEPFDAFTHWLIPFYNIGTTESGSSGAPMFNTSNRLVGTLTGGGLECTPIIDDYYQRMSNSWFDYPAVDQNLKSWLDPENTGIKAIDNLDPYLGTVEQLSNISEGATLQNLKNIPGWGYITGHNDSGTSQYAEHFFRNGSKYIYGVNMFISAAYSQAFDSKIKLKIWEGDETPEQEIYSFDIYNFELNAGSENLIRLDSLVLVDRHFFIGYEINYRLPIDTFALFHSINDSLNTAFVNRNGNWELLSDGIRYYDASLALKPLVLDYYPSTTSGFGDFPFDDVSIYPNPAIYEQQVLFKNTVQGTVNLTVYDLMGNKILNESFISPERNIRFDTQNLSEGLYLLKIDYDGNTAVKKFVKNR
jgi:lysyl endopeptidase